jgi:putative oxidoreductase
MKRPISLEIICSLLILLFVYAALSKLFNYHLFKDQLSNQLLPSWSAPVLTWLLPGVELLTAILLLIRKYRMAGLIFSFLLMVLFTGYIGLVLSRFFGRIPCSCGGILENMGWHAHLWFNILLTLMAGVGIILLKRHYKSKKSGTTALPKV